MDLNERLKEIKRLKAIEKSAKEAYEARKGERERFEQDTHSFMVSIGTESTKVDGVTYGRRTTTYGTVQDRELFEEWVRSIDMEEEYLTIKENKQRINELVRTAIEDGHDLPPGLGWYPKNFISVSDPNKSQENSE